MTTEEQFGKTARDADDPPDLVQRAGGNVAGLLSASAMHALSAPCLVTTGEPRETSSWTEVNHAVDAKAAELVAAGLRPGDRAATKLASSAEFVVSFLAVLRAGGVAVPLTPHLSAGSTAALLRHSGATVLITGESGTGELPPEVSVLGGAQARELPAGSPAPEPARGSADLAMIAYVAGVDSPPRGAMYSHRALLTNAAQLCQALPAAAAGRARALIGVPLTHLYGLVGGLLPALAAGWSMLLPGESADAGEVLAAAEAERATMLVGSPALYAELSTLGDERLGAALATVSTMLCGPTSAHPQVHAAIRRATGLGLAQCYGRAEVAGVLTSTLACASAEPSSVGVPLAGNEVLPVDSGGERAPVPLDPGDPADVFSDDDTGTGLLAARGPALSSGFWPGGEFAPDAAGWARTGDVGYVDPSGQLYLVDRAGDLILVQGFNVYPHEVERVIAELPEVAEVAVIGVREHGAGEATGGEAVRAVVVLAPGAELTAERVVEHCTAELPAYKVPSEVRFAAELPRTPTGLLRRNRVRS